MSRGDTDTLHGVVVNTVKEHNHAADAARLQVKAICAQVKEAAETTQQTTRQIIIGATNNVSTAIQGQIVWPVSTVEQLETDYTTDTPETRRSSASTKIIRRLANF